MNTSTQLAMSLTLPASTTGGRLLSSLLFDHLASLGLGIAREDILALELDRAVLESLPLSSLSLPDSFAFSAVGLSRGLVGFADRSPLRSVLGTASPPPRAEQEEHEDKVKDRADTGTHDEGHRDSLGRSEVVERMVETAAEGLVVAVPVVAVAAVAVVLAKVVLVVFVVVLFDTILALESRPSVFVMVLVLMMVVLVVFDRLPIGIMEGDGHLVALASLEDSGQHLNGTNDITGLAVDHRLDTMTPVLQSVHLGLVLVVARVAVLMVLVVLNGAVHHRPVLAVLRPRPEAERRKERAQWSGETRRWWTLTVAGRVLLETGTGG